MKKLLKSEIYGSVNSISDPQISLFCNFFIKNGFHGTVHTFKNYFAIVFSVFSFQFQQNKFYPYEPIIKTWNRTLIFENTHLMKNIGRVRRVYLQTSLEKNFFKWPIKLLTLRMDFSNYVYKKKVKNWSFSSKKKDFFVSSY